MEDHAFTEELAEREIPVAPPLRLAATTLHRFGDFRFAFYARRGGRAPELDNPETLEWMGRFIGRIHAVGALRRFESRPALDIKTFGDEPSAYLREKVAIPDDLRPAYFSVLDQALAGVRECLSRARVHCLAPAWRLSFRQRFVDR